MNRQFLLGLTIILLIPLAPLTEWGYYRDREAIVCPISSKEGFSIRNDMYGEGYFGAKRRGGRKHKGIDISAPIYEEVLAAKGGKAKVKYQKNGMGKYIVIDHPDGYSTLYGHLSGCRVKNNSRVRQGAVIGYVGKTGNADVKRMKAHLHFEIIKQGTHIDPLVFLKKYEKDDAAIAPQ